MIINGSFINVLNLICNGVEKIVKEIENDEVRKSVKETIIEVMEEMEV